LFIIQKSKLWFSKLFRQVIIKVWSTFSKVVGVGKAHKYFPFMQSDVAKQLAVWRLEHNGVSLKKR